MADGVYEINEIIGRRITETGKEEYLVHWKKYKARESTWEPLENLRSVLGNVVDFVHKAYPLPGLFATEILHLKPKAAALPVQTKLKKLAQVSKKKLRGIQHRGILDEIMRQKAKEIEMKKEKVVVKRRGRKKGADVERYVLRSEDGSVFNGQTLDTNLNCATPTSPGTKRKRKRSSVDDNHTLRPMSPRKSKDHALLAMASANMKINNNFDWFSIGQDTPAADHSIRTTRTHGELRQSVMVSREGSIMKLTLCNEEKQNALTQEMCEQLVAAFHDASKDDVNVVVITGAGKHFCSGLDYSCLFSNQKGTKLGAKLLVEKFKLLVEVIINFSKPLVAAVNGSAMGFGTSLLALCDVVYISEKVTLETSFTKWGHTPIGCCTYTFPQVLGQAAACSLLLFSGQLTAVDAVDCGLVVEKFDTETFSEEVVERLKILAAFPTKCIQDTKSLLLHNNTQQMLKDTNTEECKMLLKYLLDERGVATLAKIWKKDVMG